MTPFCVISLIAVVIPNEVASPSAREPCVVVCVASTCSSMGCQSEVYFNSKRLTVMLRGGPKSAVDEMVHVVPARATRTRSIPTREPEMNSVNSAVPSKAWLTGPAGVCAVANDWSVVAARSAAVQ